ncbi:biotin synthase auxiliary protein BsaP [Herbidospora cretacea]|uniref:biotin synthase auxiliary protein BsaP n=1 Tax=Herbidospora cretacea TaxID=28444 RepID=UPI0009ED98EE
MLVVRPSQPIERQDVDLYCDHCGGLSDDGDHGPCQGARAMEPPRYCAKCRRRMTVQVTPTGWSARCSQHGLTAA